MLTQSSWGRDLRALARWLREGKFATFSIRSVFVSVRSLIRAFFFLNIYFSEEVIWEQPRSPRVHFWSFAVAFVYVK